MTKATDTYERIEALVAEGSTQADAFKQLAQDNGQPVDSVRGAYYTGRKQATGTATPRSRRISRARPTTEEDAIERAVATLEDSIAQITKEIETARTHAQEAQREYEEIETTATPRITAIRAKIEALTDKPS